MMENMQSPQSSDRTSDPAEHDEPHRTPGPPSPREASPRRDDASAPVTNERWDSDLEADQTEDLIGREAIQDREVTDEEFPEEISEDF